MAKKRILIISDSIRRNTGYSCVARNIMTELLKYDYEIAQLGLADIPIDPRLDQLPIKYYSTLKDHTKCCGRGHLIDFYDHAVKNYQSLMPNLNVDLHPQAGFCPNGQPIGPDAFGQESCFFIIQHFKPDILMTINDVWGLYHINMLKNRKNFIYVPYLAIDSECFPMMIPAQHPQLPPIDTIQFIAGANKVVVFTKWAQEVINVTTRIATRGKTASNIEVIPHGVDRTKFYKLPNKDELRQKYFNIKPEDKVFLIGCVQRNQIRKNLGGIFQTMRKFIDKYEDKNKMKLMCHFHTSINDQFGWDLPWLATFYGLQDRCIFDNKIKPGEGVSIETLNEIMNSYDVHLSLTNSEGFSLSILESMACGVPNIATDYSAHAEWGKDVLLPVKIVEKVHDIKTGHLKGIASTDNAAFQLSLLYNSPKMCQNLGEKGINLADELDWKNIVKKWSQLFESIDISKLGNLNRYDTNIILPKHLFKIPENPTEQSFELVDL